MSMRWTWGITGALALGLWGQACGASDTTKKSSGAGSDAASGSGGNLSLTTGTGGIDPSSGSGAGDSCVATFAEAKEGALPADIVFLVDNSGSMTDEAKGVQDSMNDFSSILVGSGIDYHVILISADNGDKQGVCVPAPLGSGSCPKDEKLPSFRHVFQTVDSNNGLDLVLSTYPQWKDSLRPTARRVIAIITDDNADVSAAQFTTQLIALDPTFKGFKFDGIIAPYAVNPVTCGLCSLQMKQCSQCDPCCGKDSQSNLFCVALPAAEGKVYKDLIGQTMGVQGNLCTQQFKPVFQDMAKSVVANAKVPCVYKIPNPPDNQQIDFGKVNVEYKSDPKAQPKTFPYVQKGKAGCDNSGGWYYDDPNKPTTILLCDATCQEVQKSGTATVNVKFGCATTVK